MTRCTICSNERPCPNHSAHDQEQAVRRCAAVRCERVDPFAEFELVPVDPRELKWAEINEAQNLCMCLSPMIRCDDRGCRCTACGRAERMRLMPVRLDREVAHVVRVFASKVLHGDEQHQKWLLEAAEAFIDGRPLPAPYAPVDWTQQEMRERLESIRDMADMLLRPKPQKGKRANVRFE